MYIILSFACQQSLSGYLKQVVVVQREDERRHSLRLEKLPPDLQVLIITSSATVSVKLTD